MQRPQQDAVVPENKWLVKIGRHREKKVDGLADALARMEAASFYKAQRRKRYSVQPDKLLIIKNAEFAFYGQFFGLGRLYPTHDLRIDAK